MKKILVLIAAALIAVPSFAQNQLKCRPEPDCRLNLTEEQQKQIQTIRAAHRQEAQAFQLDMNILRAEYKKLVATGAPEKEINAKIDEMTTLQNKRMKSVSRQRLEIRKLLTEEQQAMFDDLSCRRHCKEGFHRYHPGQGYGRCSQPESR